MNAAFQSILSSSEAGVFEVKTVNSGQSSTGVESEFKAELSGNPNTEQKSEIMYDRLEEAIRAIPEFLIDLFRRSSTHLTDDEQLEFAQVLIEYQDRFAKGS
jgi:hypothetical protein